MKHVLWGTVPATGAVGVTIGAATGVDEVSCADRSEQHEGTAKARPDAGVQQPCDSLSPGGRGVQKQGSDREAASAKTDSAAATHRAAIPCTGCIPLGGAKEQEPCP